MISCWDRFSKVLELAQNDPRLFFRRISPILIDEIQKAPELLETIKILCDESDLRGQFWLTGSQRKKIMEKSQESLAGRLGILRLYGAVPTGKSRRSGPCSLDFTMACLQSRKALLPDNDINAVFEHIWKGGYIDVQNATPEQAQTYYQSYLDNYLVADAVNDGDQRRAGL